MLELSLGVADLLMVRGLGHEATAAIGLTRQIAFLLEASALAVATGVIALVSQGTGAGDRRQVEGVMHQGTRLVLLLSPPITLVGYLLSRPLLVAMQADEAALTHAVPYLHIYFLGTVFLWGTVHPRRDLPGNGRREDAPQAGHRRRPPERPPELRVHLRGRAVGADGGCGGRRWGRWWPGPSAPASTWRS